MYSFVGSILLGSSVGGFLGVIIGDGTVWEECIPIGMVPESEAVASLGDYNYVRGRVEQ